MCELRNGLRCQHGLAVAGPELNFASTWGQPFPGESRARHDGSASGTLRRSAARSTSEANKLSAGTPSCVALPAQTLRASP